MYGDRARCARGVTTRTGKLASSSRAHGVDEQEERVHPRRAMSRHVAARRSRQGRRARGPSSFRASRLSRSCDGSRTTSASVERILGRRVAAVRDRDHAHARSVRGADAVARVLDRRAPLGRHVEPRAASRKTSGAGLPRPTSSDETVASNDACEARRVEDGVDHAAVRRRREREAERLREPRDGVDRAVDEREVARRSARASAARPRR